MGLREWAASLRALGAVAYRSWEAYVGYLALALYLASVVYGSDVERSTTGKRVLSTLQPWAGTATVVLGFIAVVHAYHVLRVRLVPCLVMTFGTGPPYSQEALGDIPGHQAAVQLYRVGLGNIGDGTL